MDEERKTELDVEPATPKDTQQEQEAQAPPETEKKVEAPTAKKRSRLKIYIIVGLLATALALGVFVISLLLTQGKTAEVKPSQNVEEELLELGIPTPTAEVEQLKNLLMEPFVISTGGPGSKQFMRIRFSLQLSNEDAITEVKENLDIMREAVYLFVRNRGASDFTIPESRVETLKTLKRILDRSIQNGRVERVMITELSVY